MNVLDLFSGIGGFSLGLERAGMRTVAFCEIEPFARGVLAKHWPGIPCDGDITAREFIQGEADVICGGFPCQDISTAGSGAGLAGERSGLWREFLRAIRVVRPRYAVVENVAALLSRGMGTVLGDLAQVGYDAEWHCIPASAVGAPHRRDRVWIAANPRSEQHEGHRPPLSGEIAAELSRAVADAYGDQLWQQPICECGSSIAPQPCPDGSQGPLAYSHDQRELQPQRCECDRRGWPSDRGQDVEDAECIRRNEVVEPIIGGTRSQGPADPIEHPSFPGGGSWWAIEPDVGRVAHGIPARVDRLKGLGNAVVPQIPEIIGRVIMTTVTSGQGQ